MIGKLTGIFNGYYNNIAIIDIQHGECCIGYEVLMKTSDIFCLKQNELATLYIKEIIKEDDDVLYGFLNFEDKCWFEELIKLSGLGPKGALAILSTYSVIDITNAILSNNCVFFSSVSGIGAKLANRIPKEMEKSIEKIREKLATFYNNPTNNITQNLLVSTDASVNKKKNKITNMKADDSNLEKQNIVLMNDAIEALIALGFSKQQVYKDVFEITRQDKNLKSEDIVKQFLQKKEN